MQYEILHADSASKLEDQVRTAIANGWEPLGGVSVSSYYATWTNSRKGYNESETVYIFAQAVVNHRK